MQNDVYIDESSDVAIVGAGAVGAALARRLVQAGYRVNAVVSRESSSAKRLAQEVGASVWGDDVDVLPEETSLVILCVPDDAILDLARALAELPRPWERTIVAHTSGAKGSEALSPLAEQGAAVLSFHPLQTFTSDTGPGAFQGIAIGIEGDDRGASAGVTLARGLGARPVVLTGRQKALYHCAAVLASNGLVALLAVVRELFAAAGVDEAAGLTTDLVTPLVEQTWANLSTASPEEVLTGPVARGDNTTLEAHLEALQVDAPHLIPLYAALSTEMSRTAVRGGHLDATEAEELLQIVQNALEDYSEGPNSPEPFH